MKPYILNHLILIILFATIFSNNTVEAQTHFITYNIKYDDKNDKINNWNDRKGYLVKQLLHYEASIFGLQEAMYHQCQYIDSSLTNFTYVGVGRDDGFQKGEFSPIFYDSTKFEPIQSGTFWLSKTPGNPSKGWDAALPRVCTYALLKEKSQDLRFWVFNTHFDHKGVEARIQSAELIINQIKTFNGENLPVILMGDFNVEPHETAIYKITDYMTDALTISTKPLYGPLGTFNGFTQDIIGRRIDYFFTKNVRVFGYTHLDDRLPNNKHISDHLPVLINVSIGKQ